MKDGGGREGRKGVREGEQRYKRKVQEKINWKQWEKASKELPLKGGSKVKPLTVKKAMAPRTLAAMTALMTCREVKSAEASKALPDVQRNIVSEQNRLLPLASDLNSERASQCTERTTKTNWHCHFFFSLSIFSVFVVSPLSLSSAPPSFHWTALINTSTTANTGHCPLLCVACSVHTRHWTITTTTFSVLLPAFSREILAGLMVNLKDSHCNDITLSGDLSPAEWTIKLASSKQPYTRWLTEHWLFDG